MAEKEATSSHLDSMMHVYDNGTTARLYVTPWDRNTVADGYWQTVNTIQPLINRDIYLADALDKLASKYTVYNEGDYISITPSMLESDQYIISVTGMFDNVPSYQFDSNHFNTEDLGNNKTRISLKFKDETIMADSNGIYSNIDELINETKEISSISSFDTNSSISAFTYDYSTATLNWYFATTLPCNLNLDSNGSGLFVIG